MPSGKYTCCHGCTVMRTDSVRVDRVIFRHPTPTVAVERHALESLPTACRMPFTYPLLSCVQCPCRRCPQGDRSAPPPASFVRNTALPSCTPSQGEVQAQRLGLQQRWEGGLPSWLCCHTGDRNCGGLAHGFFRSGDAYQRTLTRITSARGRNIRRLVNDTFLRFFSGVTSELEWEDTAGQILGD